jgi:hypothetical protein
MITVQADGLEWPLETFIDAHRYQRTGGEIPGIAGADFIVLTLSRDGVISEGIARHADWADVLAYRPRGFEIDYATCEWCGDYTDFDDLYEAGNGMACGPCLDDAEYD